MLEALRSGRSIAEIFEGRVARHPTKIGLQTPERDYSYQAINEAANRVGLAVSKLENRRTGPVVFWLEDALAVAASLMGVWKAGRAFVSGNLQAPDAYNRALFESAKPAAVITERKFAAQVEALLPRDTPVLVWEDLREGAGAENLHFVVGPDTLMRIVYTSGSTGQPKGVEHNQNVMLQEAYGAMKGAFFQPTDRILQLSSLSHVNGSDLLFYAFIFGATLSCYPLKERGVERLGEWIEEKQVTYYFSVPTVFRHLVRMPQLTTAQLARIRVAHLGGEPVRLEDVRRFRRWFPKEAKLIANIGSTEAGSFARQVFHYDTPLPEKLVPLGRAHAGVELQLWDENELLVRPGEVGEIVVFGEGVAQGYYGDPGLTAERFRADPENPRRQGYKTGDLGWFDDAGVLHSAGRKDRQVKIRGHRVELAEIEAALAEHPQVEEIVVIGSADAEGRLRLVGYYSAAPQGSVLPLALRDWARERLPAYMVPTYFERMSTWPTTVSGKLDRGRLPVADLPQAEKAVAATELDWEQKLVTIWQHVFDIETVSVADDFFALGGDSLHATSLMAEIEAVSGKRLPASVLLEAPTLRELAKRVELAPARPGNFVSLGGGDGDTVLLMVHGWRGTITQYIALAGRLHFGGPVVGLQDDEQTGAATSYDSVTPLAQHYGDLIIQTYPDKKYVLAGHSAGGILAYVIATELKARGRAVELLIAIDSLPHGVPLPQRGGMMVPHLKTRFRVHADRIRTMEPRAAAGYLWQRMRAALLLAKKVVRPVQHGADKYGDLLARHRLDRSDTRVALIQCQETPQNLIHAWRFLVGDHVRNFPLDGNHDRILKHENAETVARRIETILTEYNLDGARILNQP